MFLTLNTFLIFQQLLIKVNSEFSDYLEGPNKVNRERSNVVNKGIWVRTLKEEEKSNSPLNYIFRGNSVDVDNVMQGEFSSFDNGNVPNSPFITSYVERHKRDVEQNLAELLVTRNLKLPSFGTFKKRFRKNTEPNNVGDSILVKSKILSSLKPASFFNDYPHEIAILLRNDEDALEDFKNYTKYVINETVIPFGELRNKSFQINATIDNNNNNSIANIQNMFEKAEKSHKIEILDGMNYNRSEEVILENNKGDRESKRWTSPYENPGYKNSAIRPKFSPYRPVSERGLIKVLSMLTNTFKKVMQQHNEIREIHSKLRVMNENFMKNIEVVSDKFQEFDSKYAFLVNLNQKIEEMERKVKNKEDHFLTREKELSKNLIEFEIQQKKFLTQQRQFYNIQKLMLAQNERINAKQNAIAKTQSEISHRQNNFARILKKAKQVYSENKMATLKSSVLKVNKTENTQHHTKDDDTTTMVSVIPIKQQNNSITDTTETVKINLFSIPTVPTIKNHDHLLLNEKDEKTVDDLVYKYYFNNTFIDSLMRTFLSGVMSIGESNNTLLNVKTKRGQVTEATTILVAVNKTENTQDLSGKAKTRKRRWISSHSKKRHNKHKRTRNFNTINTPDEKPVHYTTKAPDDNNDVNIDSKEGNRHPVASLDTPTTNKNNPLPPNTNKSNASNYNFNKKAAFLGMARGFCIGIGQNTTIEILNWCMEKALRRLRSIDSSFPDPLIPRENAEFSSPSTNPASTASVTEHMENNITTPHVTIMPNSESPLLRVTASVSDDAMRTEVPTVATVKTTRVPETNPLSYAGVMDATFFPDNDKLESYLKQYEMTPDTEGNVYYDGSLHASDVIKDDSDSAEFLQGYDSNSQIDNMDPSTFDANGGRRALLSRNMFSRMKYASMIKKVSRI